MTHLNVEKNKTISDYEAFFILVEKLIKEKTEQGAKGIVIAKGQPNEKKFSYTQAGLVLQTLENSAAIRGCFSFGVCYTCKKYDTMSYPSGFMGTCKLDRKEHGYYDTCDKHSKEGGGFGV